MRVSTDKQPSDSALLDALQRAVKQGPVCITASVRGGTSVVLSCEHMAVVEANVRRALAQLPMARAGYVSEERAEQAILCGGTRVDDTGRADDARPNFSPGETVELHAGIYPKIDRALTMILADSGGLNRVECPDGPPRFLIPRCWIPGLPIVENALYGLTPEELSTFCTGEKADIDRIEQRSLRLRLACKFLEDFFEGWNYAPWEVENFLVEGVGDARY